MQGVTNGVYVCQQERTEALNRRLYSRNIPSNPLQPQFSMRPVPTKYTLMPLVDERKPSTVPINRYPTYHPSQVFNPGTAQAPWSGYATEVNKESTLRNQFFALQKCNQKEYVPGSTSELYHSTVPYSDDGLQVYPDLFVIEAFPPFDPNTLNIGHKTLHNFTRNQLQGACSNRE